MRILLRLLPLFLLATGLAAATRVKTYTVTLLAGNDGSGRATATLLLQDCVPGPFVVPLGFDPADLRTDAAPTGAKVEPGTRSVRVTLPEGVAKDCKMAFSFPVAQVFQAPPKASNGEKPIPPANRMFKHALVNTQAGKIEEYRFELRLAEGQLVQGIREQLPKLGKTEAGPRVRLDKVDQRQGATLRVNNLAQGDSCGMTLETTPARRSLLWLLAGVVLGGVYLVYFRDIAMPKRA